MSKKVVYIIALLLLILVIGESCIVVVPRGSNTHGNSNTKDRIKGNFLVKASKKGVEFKDGKGIIYEIKSLSKDDHKRLVSMSGEWVNAEIQILSKSKNNRRTAKLIRLL